MERAMKLRYPGAPVYFNGQYYYIPSLSTRDFRANADKIANASEEATVIETWDQYIPIIGLAIRRNYPEMSDELLEEHLDVYTFNKAYRACLNASGTEPVNEGEKEPASGL
jgi:hypothetical protein